ncbi:LamG-like jellyroll fold domain-containing protein [Aeoliella sp.]|uniref:LamG-like jellyroll fold domain-containing protein n=1 Tax=Aeoliella sp. TaxID=2795800 RepID=UPI003CCBA356
MSPNPRRAIAASPAIVLAVFALVASAYCQAANVLMVIDRYSIIAEESSRKTAFESWGHTVTTITDILSQSEYDTALVGIDVVYVCHTVDDPDVSYKLRTATCGVVNEHMNLDDEFGFATGGGYNHSWHTIEGVDNTHDVTSGLSSGDNVVTGTSQNLSVNGNTLGAGVQVLGTMNYGALSVGVIETGGALANSYSGNSSASGRRVRLPWGSGTWDNLNSTGLLFTQNALNWASGGAGSGLLLHLELEETSGTTAVDSSTNGNDAVYVASPELGATGKRGSAIGLQADTQHDRIDVPISSIDGRQQVSVAWWMRTSKTGEQAILSGANSSYSAANAFLIFFYSDTTFRPYMDGTNRSLSIASIADGRWHHYVYTHDRTTGDSELFIDGLSAGTLNFPARTGTYEIASNGLVIGEEQDSPGGGFVSSQAFDGYLDDFRIYDYILSHAEIVELYGLVGHWKFNETSGSTLADSSPNGNDATFNTGTPSWVSGVRSGGLQFNGSNDADTDASFDPPATGSVAFWYRFSDAPSGAQQLLGTSGDWRIRTDSGGAIYIDLGGDGVASGCQTPSGSADAGAWHHLVAIYDDEDDEFKVYLDGGLVASGSMTVTDQSAATLSLGARTGSSERFNGALDDVRVYNYEISETEVAELYGLIGHWKLDESSGTVANDTSLKGTDGMHTNGVTVNAEGPYPGLGDTAAEFDGLNDHVSLPAVSSEFDDGVTMAVWARPTDNKMWARFFEMGNGEWVDNFLLARESVTNDLTLHIHDGSIGSGYIKAIDGIIQNEWHHYVAVVDSNGNAVLYRDAVVLQTGTTGVPNNNERSNTYIGRSNWGSDGYYEGRMHDVRLYNRPLSQSEVAELFGLVAHWRLDESSGFTAYDSSGVGNDATLTGTQDWISGQIDGGGGCDYSDGDDYFTAPTTTVLNNVNEGSYSVTAWYKPLSVPTGSGADNHAYQGVLIKEGWHTGLYYNYEQRFEFVNYLNGYNWTGTGTWSKTYSTGKFHHLAGVVNLPDGTLELYVDGQLQGTDTFTPGLTGQDLGSTPWRIGIGGPGLTEWRWPAHGVIDGVRIYNRPLNAEEVDQIYSSGTTTGIRIIKWVEAR